MEAARGATAWGLCLHVHVHVAVFVHTRSCSTPCSWLYYTDPGEVCRENELPGVLTDWSPEVLSTCHSLSVDGRLEFTLFVRTATL